MNSSTLQSYRLDISYNGKNFNGFQSQRDGRTVQDHLEKALTTFLRGKTPIRGASRTDSGVHAYGQVAIFRTAKPFEAEQLLRGVNALTPDGLGVTRVESVSEDFDPISDAVGKAYRYSLWCGRCHNPFLSPFVWQIDPKCDLGKIYEAANYFIGTFDFTSFCSKDSDARNKIRSIKEVKVVQRGELIDIWFIGDGFLKQMIRIIVGTIVDIALGRLSLDDLEGILQAKDRQCAGLTAPPQGLTLIRLFYSRIPSIKEVINSLQNDYYFDF